MTVWRSLLFVPGDAPERLAGAPGRGADAIILDLEDAVAPAAKPGARAAAAGRIADLAEAGAEVVVRINAGWRDMVADLEAIADSPVSAVMVPKSASAWRTRAVAELVDEIMEARPGVIALVETAEGIGNAGEIAAVDGVTGLAFGSEDFSLDLGVAPTPEALDLPCRQLVLAAASAGAPCFGLPDSLANFRDMEAFEAAAQKGRGFGVAGLLCIHPRQVAVANRVFGATDAEREHAHRVLAAWDARAEGQGVASLDGRMLDAPVVARARRTLERRPAGE